MSRSSTPELRPAQPAGRELRGAGTGTGAGPCARLGLGGEGPVLRSHGRRREAVALIGRALELGVTYFDTARAYADSEAYLGAALGAERERVFIASKTAERSAAGAQRDLAATLRNLRTERLDLWQLHDLRDPEQWRQAARRGGALEALERARDAGDVGLLGVTAHCNPDLLEAVLRAYRFDAVLMPVNVLESRLGGFSTGVLAAARERASAVVGMLVMAQGVLPRVGVPAEWLLRFALAEPVEVLAVGAESCEQLEENVRSAAKGPLGREEQLELIGIVEPFAQRLAFYCGRGALAGVDAGGRDGRRTDGSSGARDAA